MQTSTKPLKDIETVQMSPLQQRLRWVLHPTDYLIDAAKQHPVMFRSKVTGYEDALTIVYHPEAIKQILTNDYKQFSAPGDINQILTPMVGHKSLLNLDGKRHRRERKLIMPSFHGERMYHYGQKIVEITRQQLQQIPVGQSFQALELTQQITVRLILQIIFGIQGGDRYEKIIQGARHILNGMTSPIMLMMLFFPGLQKNWGAWSPWGRFLKLRQELDALIYAEIGDRRQNFDPERTDILTLMMAATDEAGGQMSDEELRDELMLLIFAGHDTTAIAMAWGLYWLHAFPHVKQKLQAELSTLGDHPDPMAVFSLPYLTAICQETLRINPVGMFSFPRRAEQDMELMGYQMPQGENILCSIYLLHQNETLYPNPRQFRPERFLERQFSPYDFMPFGGGVRRCVGEALAMYELKLSLATLSQFAEFILLEESEPKCQRRGVVLAPKGGICLQLKGINS